MDALTQLVFNGLYAASIYALLAVGWALIFGTGGVFHMSFGVPYAAGAYCVAAVHDSLPIAILIAVVVSGGIGALLELALYKPLRHLAVRPTVAFVGSVGVMTVASGLIVLLFGPRPAVVPIPAQNIPIGTATLTNVQLITIAVSVVTVASFLAYWYASWGGRMWRAVTSNPSRARLVGIDVEMARLSSAIVGSCLAGSAGILLVLNEAATPQMLLTGLLISTTAVLVGGYGSMIGAAIGAIFLALAINVGIWRLSSRWQYAIAFAILMVFIMFRPRGMFGQKLPESEI